MWPFSKINKLETELMLITNKLDEMVFQMGNMQQREERQYNNICRVLDIIVLEARENNKVFTDIMQKRLVQVEIDLHQAAEEALTTAEILSDVQTRIMQIESKLKKDKLLS